MGQSPAVKFYRSIGVFNELEHLMNGTIRFEYHDASQMNPKTMWEQLYPYPLLFISSALNQHLLPILMQARAQGIMTWIDVDDDLFNVPRGNPALNHYRKPQNQDIVTKCLDLASVISTTTETLKELYKTYSPNIHVIPNAYNAARLPLQRPKQYKEKPVQIAWRGSHAHQEDLDDVRDVLNHIIESDQLKMTFYGWRPFFVPENLCIDWRGGWLGVFDYIHRLAGHQPDYLLVPLLDNSFNRAKSNIAWMEANIVGAVTIAPAYLPEFDLPGVLRYENKQHLKQIVADIEAERIDRNGLLNDSREEMLSRFTLSAINRKRADLIAGMFGQTASRVEGAKPKKKRKKGSHTKVRPIR